MMFLSGTLKCFLFLSFVLFSIFPYDSPADNSSKNETQALALISTLNRGNLLTYRTLLSGMSEAEIKTALQFNQNGDSVLAALLRLEKFPGDNLERILTKEVQFVASTLGELAFLQLLTEYSKSSISPLEYAKSSKNEEYWRGSLEEAGLSEKATSHFLGEPYPSQNRGVAYGVLRKIIEPYSWSSVFKQKILSSNTILYAISPVVLGGAAVSIGLLTTNGQALTGMGGVVLGVGIARCERAFRSVSKIKKTVKNTLGL